MKIRNITTDTIIKILWIGAVFACIKSIFTDTGFDNAYTVAMAYRHINGDTMFIKMWEPHQTSMFVAELLMRFYRLFVPSFTGVTIYLQVWGVIIHAFVGSRIYKLFNEVSGKTIANLTCIFYLLFNVKQSLFPDYASMQIAFSVLLFICLVKYLASSKIPYLILAAVFLCLEVLAYPSCLIAYVAVIVILCLKSSSILKDIAIFTATCAFIGLVYAGYFIVKIGFLDMVTLVQNIFLADSHSTTPNFYQSYVQGFPIIIFWLAISLIAAFLVRFAVYKIRNISLNPYACFGVSAVIFHFAILVLQKKLSVDFYCSIYIIPLALIVFSCFGFNKLNDSEKTLWIAGICISVASFFSTQLLTDLGLLTVCAYLVLGGIVSFVPISRMKKETISLLVAVCACVVIHRTLVVWGYGNKWGVNFVYEVENIVRSGPNAGVVCDYMTYYMTEESIKDHNAYIREDDKVLVVDTWVSDPIDFLLHPGEISNPTTIDTLVFNENTLEYFRYNPDKTPTAIAVSCWYGNLAIDPDSFIMGWITDNYDFVGDGSYWRYYRVK